MEKFFNKLTKDISKRTGTTYTVDTEYIKLCLKEAYYRGKVDAGKEHETIYNTIFKTK